MKRHITGDPDVVHTAQDPAECACQKRPEPAEDDPNIIDEPVTND